MTKPLRFKGKQLLLNHVVRPGGALTVETVDQSGAVTGKSKQQPLVAVRVDRLRRTGTCAPSRHSSTGVTPTS